MAPMKGVKLVSAFEKFHCSRCRCSHRRPVGRDCNRNPASQKLADLLRTYTFQQLLDKGLILNAEDFAEKVGVTPQHLRLLCRQEPPRTEHIERQLGGAVQYFFFPEQVSEVFSIVKLEVQ